MVVVSLDIILSTTEVATVVGQWIQQITVSVCKRVNLP